MKLLIIFFVCVSNIYGLVFFMSGAERCMQRRSLLKKAENAVGVAFFNEAMQK